MRIWIWVLVMAAGLCGCAGDKRSVGTAGAGAVAATSPAGVVRVEILADAGGGFSGVTVDGKECGLNDLARALRAARPVVCEIRVPAAVGYEYFAKVLIAAAQADVRKLRLGIEGGEMMAYEMPAIDKGAVGTGSGQMPAVRVKVDMTRREGATWVGAFGRPAVRISKAGEADQRGNAELSELFKQKGEELSPDVDAIIRPMAEVSCGEVLEIYGDCVRGKLLRVAFSPATDAEPATQPALVQERRMTHRIVYIVDHSAAVGKSFDAVREEVVRSVNNMIPVQQFDVVMLGEKSEAIFSEMQKATPNAKHDFGVRMGKIQAEGVIEGKLGPFQEAFEKAFALQPDVVYFLSASSFDPALLKVAARLNADNKVHVNTIVFERKDEKFEAAMKELARSNGGTYKFVSPKVVEAAATQGR